MKRFVFSFTIVGYPEGVRGRIYATPVKDAPKYIRISEIYKPKPIKDGDGWGVLHLTVWSAAGLKAGTYLIHVARGLVFRLSGNGYLTRHNLRSLAGYAESKYLKNI